MQALKEYVLEDWKYSYKKHGEKGLDELKADVINKFGAEMGPDNNTATLVADILSKAGELEGISKF